ncbi:TPA: AzlC family ABC transporter permease [Streptococcus pneumoniae]|uniref:AzlC family ABC transporter permease n=1 Tax=Streptococcus pneumoniae TaxID=1313 RepID=UPI0002972247|nr:AzlC family ABC transporter permease [Streptococcus pneumoniae]ELU73649.1 AzlC protein [Streptococcus pneumoniae PNI0008]ELU74486.1 AzlC protein [Streptococcus pneumoniae PNI0007]ELU79452.1 AzlC protein [Streptococcus pneumoniae PNI0009]AFS42299.1 AzlC family protein [Streptococcus pneumoniae gamPNI0373]ELU60879.1 AzlC protein [Streptococcus pneumoniae PCS125219]
MPTALGYVSIGLACGTIGAPYVTPVEMGLMSLFVYAGSAQFAMLALIVVQAPVAAIAMTVFLINLRLFLLSLHASTYFRHTSLWYNIGMSSILTDETYGVLMGELAHTDKVNPMWMHGNNLNSYVAWFVGTVVGTALGGLLPNPEIFALILSSVVTGKVGSLPQIKWLDFLAVFPTVWVAFRYRNLVGTVLFGVVLIAILRLVF